MRKKWMTMAVVAAALQVGCAHAQERPAPTVTSTGNGMTVTRAPSPYYTGYSYSGSPVVLADGSVRFAEPPVITEVAPGSPAALVGLQPGDQIVEVNGRDGRDPTVLRARAAGQEFVLRIRRGTELRDVTLVSAPNPAAAQN